ncbi:hypothetical protein AC1031_005005 [Aphanomyces cochlioides]|nr:hypothetical protein AC1031_005005 [Aphanomyces cochlioides]
MVPAAEAAGKFNKLSTSSLSRAKSMLDKIGKVSSALDSQCAVGCLGATTCSNLLNSSATSACSDTSQSALQPTPVTLNYSPPAGCVCVNTTFTDYTKDAQGHSIDMCAHNIAFIADDVGVLMNKAYFKDMGCFLGKSDSVLKTCPSARKLTKDDVSLEDFDYIDIQFHYFVPCIDQFGRNFSRRQDAVPMKATTCPPATTKKVSGSTATLNLAIVAMTFAMFN